MGEILSLIQTAILVFIIAMVIQVISQIVLMVLVIKISFQIDTLEEKFKDVEKVTAIEEVPNA